jgi:hypothetical protein
MVSSGFIQLSALKLLSTIDDRHRRREKWNAGDFSVSL